MQQRKKITTRFSNNLYCCGNPDLSFLKKTFKCGCRRLHRLKGQEPTQLCNEHYCRRCSSIVSEFTGKCPNICPVARCHKHVATSTWNTRLPYFKIYDGCSKHCCAKERCGNIRDDGSRFCYIHSSW